MLFHYSKRTTAILYKFLIASVVFATGLVLTTKTQAQCVNTFPYVADFEASQDGWVSGGTNNDWAWGAPTKPNINHAGSGTKCWISGGLTTAFYNYSEASYVESPCFDFTNLQHPFITLLIFEETEHKFDGANLQYSLDGGTNWTVEGGYLDTSCLEGYWYNYPSIRYLEAPISLDSTGWNGNSLANSTEGGTQCQGGFGYTGWVHAKHCMQNLAGKPNVIFRVTFGAGTTCNHFDGFAFDSVAIGEAVANSGTLTYNCTSSNTVSFTGTAGLPCSDNFAWNFGDPGSGAANTAATATATHTFSAAGTYTVSLIISGGPCNAPDTLTQVINILDVTPTVQDVSCFGGNNGSVDVTTTGGPGPFTYSWTGGASSQNITGLSAGNYTVTVTAPLSCSATATAAVTQPQVLAVTATTTGGGCSGNGGINTTVTGGTSTYTYNWGGGITTPDRTNLGTGTYTVTVTDSKGCTATASASITVSSNPTVAVNNAAVCTGGSATLTANATPAGGTYSWSTGATTNSITVSPVTTTGYTITYTSLACGSVTAVGTVAVANSATVTVSSDTICQGGSATLYATPTVAGGTYSWNTGGTLDSITVSPGTNTSYTVTYTPVGCPAAMGTGSVTVEPIPAVTLAETNPGCSHGGVITATGTGGTAPYEYSLGGGAYQDVDSFTNLASGNYTVVTKDTFGCVSPPQTTTIAPYTPLTVSSTIDSITCTVTTGTINATAAGGTSPYQYSINGGAYQNSGTFTGLAAASYTVNVQDAAGCTITETVVIPTASTIVAQATADAALCNGATDGKVVASASGGSSPYQYALNGGTYQNSGTFANLAAGNYTINVKDANGCLATQNVQVSQPSPLVFTSVTATGVKCQGEKNGTITAVGNGGTPPYNYVCTKDSVNFITTTNGVITGLDSGTYYIQLTDNNGCLITTSIVVPPATPDSFTVVADSATCNGNDGAVVVTPVFFQNAPFTYAINNGAPQSSDSFPGLAIGTYSVIVTDANGCTTTLPSVVVGQPAPAIAIAFPTDTTVRLGQTVQLGSYLTGSSVSTVNSYIWEPGDGLSCQDCQNPIATPYADQITYTVTITYNGTCTANASVLVMNGTGEVYVPNVFTPNGDGNNDVFYVYGYGIKVLILKVFNRWGEKVFESHDQLIGWDGTYKGILQMPGVFAYEATVVFLDNRTKALKGSVTLVR